MTVLTMINVCKNTQVPGVGRVSLECSNLVEAAKTHGHHLKYLSKKKITLNVIIYMCSFELYAFAFRL